MYPEINIFGLEIPSYGVMISIGVLCLIGVMFYYFRKEKISDSKIDRLLMCTAIGGLMMYVSALFFDALWHNLDTFHKTGVFQWEWWGITFSGGLFGGVLTFMIAYWFLFKNERYKFFYYFNFIITGVVIAHAFGRIGCFLAGCCYGKITDSPLGMNYPVNDYINGHFYEYAHVYPTQLFESGFLFILFIVLFFVIKKHQLRYYLLSYGTFRFILEFFRGDSRGNTIFGILSPSQFLSVVMVILGVLLIFFEDKIVDKLKRKYNPELFEEETAQTENPTEA